MQMCERATKIVLFGWSRSVHVQRWARGLTQRGYDLRVVSPGSGDIDGVETVCFPHGNWSYVRYAAAAAAAAREFKPDLVHVHYAGGPAVWALKTKLKPLVVSVWGADVMDLPRNPFFRFLIRRHLKHATAITATSELLKRVTVKLLPEAESKITVIPFGVEVPGAVIDPPATPPIKLCYIKGHRPKYGPDVLLRAMNIIRQEIPHIQLDLAGSGEFTEHLVKMVDRLKLRDHVKLPGFIPNDRIYDFIRGHHIMVMPSIMDSESFGVAVLEASVCGRPVVASRVGGVPEVLVDGKTGYLVDRGDPEALARAIIKLARDANLRSEMGSAGYEFVKTNYSWEKSLDMMTDLYERLLHGQ